MRCTQCGQEVPRTAKFCADCGTAIDYRSEAGGRFAERSSAATRAPLRGRSALAEADEDVIWEGGFSARGLIHAWLLAILITIVLPTGAYWVQAAPTEWMVLGAVIALVWLGLFGLLAFQKLNVRYVLTNRRLIHRTGILLQRTDRLELVDMNDVSHEQSIIERIFRVGTIEISTSDRSHPYIDLPGIADVAGVAMLIDDARLRERTRRGIHVEQI